MQIYASQSTRPKRYLGCFQKLLEEKRTPSFNNYLFFVPLPHYIAHLMHDFHGLRYLNIPVVVTALLVARASKGVASADSSKPKRYECLRPMEENRPPNFDWESMETISCKE